MNRYFFVLGTASELCFAELAHILSLNYPSVKLSLIVDSIALVVSDTPLDETKLMRQLGGTIKIAEEVGTIVTLDATRLVSLLVPPSPQSQFTFGFSVHGGDKIGLTALCGEIKQRLHQKGIRSRYILPTTENILSSVVIQKQQVAEFILIKGHDTTWHVGKTLTVQDSDEWGKRDFGRPMADPKSGMLPPKVARMMVNLALASENVRDSSRVLVDPFCGVGTVLAEALMMNWNVIGSDYKDNAIEQANQNLSWLFSTYPVLKDRTFRLMIQDATHITESIALATIDAIVTEPFLGAPFETKGDQIMYKGRQLQETDIPNSIKGLEKLYRGALREWYSVLKPGAILVIAFPAVSFQKYKLYTVKKLVDSCEKLGYTLSQGPYLYGRPQAIVKRHIYVFRKKNS